MSLFPQNRQADLVNERQLAQIDGDEHEFFAEARGQANLIERLKRNMLAPEHLVLKKNAVVMAVRNDAEGRYVNGSLGMVIGFLKDARGGWPIVEFENGNVVTMKRADWEMMDGDDVLASVSQVPLRCLMSDYDSQIAGHDARFGDHGSVAHFRVRHGLCGALSCGEARWAVLERRA